MADYCDLENGVFIKLKINLVQNKAIGINLDKFPKLVCLFLLVVNLERKVQVQ